MLLRERKSGSYMISAVSFERGKQIIDSIPQGNLFTLHQPFLVRYTAERFKLRDCSPASSRSTWAWNA